MNADNCPTADARNNGDSMLEPPNLITAEDDESRSLLAAEEGDLWKYSGKPKRKVRWLDSSGDKLEQVMVFQPSDVSDSEDDSDSCICRIM